MFTALMLHRHGRDEQGEEESRTGDDGQDHGLCGPEQEDEGLERHEAVDDTHQLGNRRAVQEAAVRVPDVVRIDAVVAPGIDRLAHLHVRDEDGDRPPDPESEQDLPWPEGHGRTLAAPFLDVT